MSLKKKNGLRVWLCLLGGFAFIVAFGVVACGDDDNGGEDMCGDGVCQDDEDAESCPEDCGCGNDMINEGETCDGSDLGDATCESEGYAGGELACLDDCSGFDYSGCQDQLASVTFLHTSDIHHHASGYGPFADYTPLDTTDNDIVRGGFARLGAKIREIREQKTAEDVPVLLLDSADYFMGTVYDLTTLSPTVLAFFQLMGYDAVTIGNHEWDWGPAGYAMLVDNAMQIGGFSVPIVASNMILDSENVADDAIEAFVTAGVISDRFVFELQNGLTVGVIGRLGPEAVGVTVMADPITFDTEASHIQTLVDDLRQDEGVDMVVLLSHSGIHSDGTGDDAVLAGDVDGLDVILSGHYHEIVDEPYVINDTLVTIPGRYGEWLSHLDVTYNVTQGAVEEFTFENIPIDDTITGDATVQGMVEQYHAAIDQELQAALQVGIASPIIEVPFDLPTPTSLDPEMQETSIGNMCADSLRYIATGVALQSGDATPFYTMAVVPYGVIRDGLLEGSQGVATFADVFNVLPLGMTPDPENQDAPGWPLISVYVTGAEIKAIAEVTTTVAPAFNRGELVLGISGVRVDYDPNGTTQPPDKVRHVWACGQAVADPFSQDCTTEIDITDDTQLYRIVADLYTIMSMSLVAQAGLSIVPKKADGTPVNLAELADVLTTRIDLDPVATGVQEMKTWMALLQFFLDTNVFPDDTGITGLGEITSNYEPGVGDADRRFNEI
jgi:5'-nucleotidase